MNVIETQRDVLSRLLSDDERDLVLRQGQFHQVVIGRERVVCFARTEAAAARLPERAAVLRVLSRLDLGFRTPQPLDVGGTDCARYLVMSRIPGAPLEEEALERPEVAAAVARQFVDLLNGLAAAGLDAEVRAAIPSAPHGEWQEFAADVRSELFPLMSRSGQVRAERELAALDSLPPLASAVVHGDLGGENVLWETSDGVPRLSGVIDWDEVSIGDPAEDLAAIGASYGEAMLDHVLSLGGWGGADLVGRIAAVRGTFALQQALSARRDGDEEELEDGLAGYR
ncbi:viomycin phosphotransferase [Allokutzneria oryzae]|uniref:Viomycin phosphotransferase n=1 Tax=Allokutzneria oryzae TaxID=1378989 RepID=A0ABV6A5V3_9PSEU